MANNVLWRRCVLFRTTSNILSRKGLAVKNQPYVKLNSHSLVAKRFIASVSGCHHQGLFNLPNSNQSFVRCYADDKDDKQPLVSSPANEKLSLFQRFKQMYRDYWYVLVPVHLVTSAAWFGGFYYMAKSGIDVVSILESMHVSEKITNSMKDSSMGYIAISYALYKIATPLRYTVTLGGTTISINYLKHWGYIKPMPTAQEIKTMYQEKKSDVIKAVQEKKSELEMKKELFSDKKDNLMKEMSSKISPMKTVKVKK